MNSKRAIRKMLMVAMWMVIGSGMLVLLIAAMGKQKKNTCRDYVITINGAREVNCFLGKADILNLLKTVVKGNIRGQAKASFNLQQMEAALEENVWVKDAQLYFDNKDVLHISVSEREPVARLFTGSGKSFYIDENEKGIPLSENFSTSVPVFTGVPDKKDRTRKDSLLLHEIRVAAQYINNDPFWKSQVAQVDLVQSDLNGTWEFEMVPVVGNHTVKLGNGDNIQQKFNRLFIFYKEILSRTGFDKYKTIDVRFAGQVIGGKSLNPRVDSVQLRKNVNELLQQMNKVESETQAAMKQMNKVEEGQVSLPGKSTGTPVSDAGPAGIKQAKPKSDEEKRTSKAVMKKVNNG